jgi:hypothetical protein
VEENLAVLGKREFALGFEGDGTCFVKAAFYFQAAVLDGHGETAEWGFGPRENVRIENVAQIHGGYGDLGGTDGHGERIFVIEDRVGGGVHRVELAVERFDVDGDGRREVIHHVAHLGLYGVIFRCGVSVIYATRSGKGEGQTASPSGERHAMSGFQ